jgi:hypothetical protein
MRAFFVIWIGQGISILNPRIRRLEEEVPDATPG